MAKKKPTELKTEQKVFRLSQSDKAKVAAIQEKLSETVPGINESQAIITAIHIAADVLKVKSKS